MPTLLGGAGASVQMYTIGEDTEADTSSERDLHPTYRDPYKQ